MNKNRNTMAGEPADNETAELFPVRTEENTTGILDSVLKNVVAESTRRDIPVRIFDIPKPPVGKSAAIGSEPPPFTPGTPEASTEKTEKTGRLERLNAFDDFVKQVGVFAGVGQTQQKMPRPVVSPALPFGRAGEKEAIKKNIVVDNGNMEKNGGNPFKEQEQYRSTEGNRKEGFWNSYAGDMLEKVGKGVVEINGSIYSLLDILTPGDLFRKQADNAYAYGNELGKRADRYNGNDFVDLLQDGKYGDAVGDVLLQVSEKLPSALLTLVGGSALKTSELGLAMSPNAINIAQAGKLAGKGTLGTIVSGVSNRQAATAVGSGIDGLFSGIQRYDELDRMPETKDLPEYQKKMNACIYGASDFLSGFLGDVSVGKQVKALYSKLGNKAAKGVLEKEISKSIATRLKRAGMLTPSAMKGVAEGTSQIMKNISDYTTGVSKEWKPTNGMVESMMYATIGDLMLLPVSNYLGMKNVKKEQGAVSSTPNVKATAGNVPVKSGHVPVAPKYASAWNPNGKKYSGRIVKRGKSRMTILDDATGRKIRVSLKNAVRRSNESVKSDILKRKTDGTNALVKSAVTNGRVKGITVRNPERVKVKHFDGKEYSGVVVKTENGRITVKEDVTGRTITLPVAKVLEWIES